jgi:aminoglycoside phosphotransferase (APT) family kinase protein
VTHPRPDLFCNDLRVIAAAFLVMQRVVCVSLQEVLSLAFDSPTGRERVVFSLNDALAALHRVDWEQKPLTGLGRPDD